MARWLVLGSSGQSGQALCAALAQAGHEVYAQRRSAAQTSSAEGEQLVFGLEDREALVSAVTGCDVVACVFGPRAGSADVFCAAATKQVIEVMRQVQVKRLICQTGAMIQSRDTNLSAPMRMMGRLFEMMRPAQAQDRQEQERVVIESDLDWTLIKPPRLTDEALRGEVVWGDDLRMWLRSRVGRADLAGFMRDSAARTEHHKARLFVRYGG